MKILKNKLVIALLIFIVTIIILLIFYSLIPTKFKINESIDFTLYYEPSAMNFLEGKGFTTADGEILTRYPPGHTTLIAFAIAFSQIFHIQQNIAIYAYIWISFGLVSVVIYLIAVQYWKGWIAIIPSFLWISYIPALWSSKQPNSEIPFTLVFLIAILLFVKLMEMNNLLPSKLFLVGLVFGFSMLIRPIALLIGIVLFVFILFFFSKISLKKRTLVASLFLIGAYLPALIWGLHLKKVTGHFILLSKNGLPAIIDGMTFSVSNKDYREEINLPEQTIMVMENFQNKIDERNITTLPQLFGIIGKEFFRNPAGAAQLFLIKSARSWYGLDSMRFEKIILPYQMVYLSFIAVNFLIALKNRYIPVNFTIFTLVLVMTFWGMTIIALSILRYMIPIFPLLFLFSPSIFRKFRLASG